MKQISSIVLAEPTNDDQNQFSIQIDDSISSSGFGLAQDDDGARILVTSTNYENNTTFVAGLLLKLHVLVESRPTDESTLIPDGFRPLGVAVFPSGQKRVVCVEE